MTETRSDYLPALEYLTPEQVRQVNEAIRAILDTTGAGEIVIRVDNYHPSRIGYTVWNRFKKPEKNDC